MKNRNRTGRQKYFSADRKCKNCVYNAGRRKGEHICLMDTCVFPFENRLYGRESMFFGLSLLQFIFSVLACGIAGGLDFLLKPYLGTETVSWVCILGAAPFAAIGFVKYNGMTAEKFVWAWFKSEFLMPKKLVFHSTNTYYELLKPSIEQKMKEVLKNND